MEVTLKTDSPPPTPVCSGSESGLGRSQECEPPTVCHQSRSQWDQSVSAGSSTILYHYYLVASLLPPTRHLDSTQSVGLDSSNTGIPSRLDWSCLLLPYQAKYWENFKICIKIQSWLLPFLSDCMETATPIWIWFCENTISLNLFKVVFVIAKTNSMNYL